MAAADILPNGVRLADSWPPRLTALPDAMSTPPYLTAPPAVLPIDQGRQLFLDDFLIEETTLTRTYHRPIPHPANPVLKPDKEWEQLRGRSMAMPFSGGVWFDPADGKFKAWYMGGYNQHLCYAESKDGVAWVKPDLDVVKGTNIVIQGGATESNTVWLDLNEKDPKRRVKFFTHGGGAIGNLGYRTSPDGIHDWSGEHWRSGRCEKNRSQALARIVAGKNRSQAKNRSHKNRSQALARIVARHWAWRLRRANTAAPSCVADWENLAVWGDRATGCRRDSGSRGT